MSIILNLVSIINAETSFSSKDIKIKNELISLEKLVEARDNNDVNFFI